MAILTGFYRVNYDLINWGLIAQQLLNDHQKISQINRAQIIDDSLNIARSNLLSYSTALDLTRYLVYERHFVPWRAALNVLGYLDMMFDRSADYDDFKKYMTKLISPLYDYTGFNETSNDEPLLIYTRDLASKWMCQFQDTNCVTESKNYFKSWFDDPGNDK